MRLRFPVMDPACRALWAQGPSDPGLVLNACVHLSSSGCVGLVEGEVIVWVGIETQLGQQGLAGPPRGSAAPCLTLLCKAAEPSASFSHGCV